MADVKRVAEYIQRFSELIGVAIDPLDKDGFTQVARGSATVGINVVEQKGFILFLAPIMEVPTRVPTSLRPVPLNSTSPGCEPSGSLTVAPLIGRSRPSWASRNPV